MIEQIQDRSAKRQFWQQHIEEWRGSGISQAAYCRHHDLKPHQFTYWKNRLSESDAGVSFVQLPVANTLPVVSGCVKVSLFTCNGYRIDIGTGFDPLMLKQLVQTVEQL